MVDLSKLPWDECKLPKWKGIEVYAYRPGISLASTHIHNDQQGSYAVKIDGEGNAWKTTMYATCTFAELDQLREICNQVDAWVVKETVKLEAKEKLEKEFPWSAAEAERFLRENPGEHKFATGVGSSSWYRCTHGTLEMYWNSWVTVCGVDRLLGDGYRLIESRNTSKISNSSTVEITARELMQRLLASPGVEIDATNRHGKKSRFMFDDAIRFRRVSENGEAGCLGTVDQGHFFQAGPYRVKCDEAKDEVETQMVGHQMNNNKRDEPHDAYVVFESEIPEKVCVSHDCCSGEHYVPYTDLTKANRENLNTTIKLAKKYHSIVELLHRALNAIHTISEWREGAHLVDDDTGNPKRAFDDLEEWDTVEAFAKSAHECLIESLSVTGEDITQ